MGKRGGVRIIYYYHDADAPIFLVTIYAKGIKDDLTGAETQAMKKLTDELQARIRASRRR
jgi:hypothetical protein